MRKLLSLLALSAGLVQAGPAPTGVLTIRFLDVGQGDAVVITSPDGKSLVYDGGRSESRMRELIRQYSIQNVTAVVASHADADHITGLIPIVALNRPKYFVNNGIAGTTQTWQKLTNVVKQAGTEGLFAVDVVMNLGDVKVTILPPPYGMPVADQNLNSVGILVEYAGFRALMTGDSETAETNAWLKRYPANQLGPVDVYKSIHHGAANGDHLTWLKTVQPSNVVVSVGPNDYGHPTKTALNLYQSGGASVWRTDQQGTITVTVQPSGAYSITPEHGQPRNAARPVNAQPANGGLPSTLPPGGTIKSPMPVVPPPAREVYYPNCAAVKAAGKSPLLRGQPGYRPGLDRDGDGRACE